MNDCKFERHIYEAEKLFEKIGYTCIKSDALFIEFNKPWTDSAGYPSCQCISFDLTHHGIFSSNEDYDERFGTRSAAHSLTMDEWKACNAMVGELGWNKE